MIVFNGEVLAKEIQRELVIKSQKFLKKIGRKPRVAIILVGTSPASELYTKKKLELAEKVGSSAILLRFHEVTFSQLVDQIREVAISSKVDGIVVQLPLPLELRSRQQEVLDTIPVEKDIDGLTSQSFARLAANKPCFLPAVVQATFRVIDEYKLLKPETKVVVVGAKGWVGTRVCVVIKNRGISDVVEIDKDFPERIGELKRADLIISATGQPGLIKPEMVKKGVAAIDLGVMVVEDREGRKVRGDFDPEVAKCASFFTPVPGGIGPVTVASLFENLLDADLHGC